MPAELNVAGVHRETGRSGGGRAQGGVDDELYVHRVHDAGAVDVTGDGVGEGLGGQRRKEADRQY